VRKNANLGKISKSSTEGPREGSGRRRRIPAGAGERPGATGAAPRASTASETAAAQA
jgi:hypothetical protein